MKNILAFSFGILFLSWPAFASNWVPLSKVKAGTIAAYQTAESCVRLAAEECLDVGDDPEAMTAGFASYSEQWSEKFSVQDCVGESDCQEKLVAKVCSSGKAFIDVGFTQVYCSQKIGVSLVIDQAGLNSYKAAKGAQAQTDALIAMGAKADADCQKVLHLIGGLNLLPGRTQDQIDTMVSSLAPIKAVLQDGRPGKARGMIEAITPDGVVVTAQMKALVLSILKDWAAE